MGAAPFLIRPVLIMLDSSLSPPITAKNPNRAFVLQQSLTLFRAPAPKGAFKIRHAQPQKPLWRHAPQHACSLSAVSQGLILQVWGKFSCTAGKQSYDAAEWSALKKEGPFGPLLAFARTFPKEPQDEAAVGS